MDVTFMKAEWCAWRLYFMGGSRVILGTASIVPD